MTKTTTKSSTNLYDNVISGKVLPKIHNRLRPMVNNAYYDLSILNQLQKKVGPVRADQMTVLVWDYYDGSWEDYTLNPTTGEVWTKFHDAYPPSHKAIRFVGHEKTELSIIWVKNVSFKELYNVIATALLKKGVKPFIVLSKVAILTLPENEIVAVEIINATRSSIGRKNKPQNNCQINKIVSDVTFVELQQKYKRQKLQYNLTLCSKKMVRFKCREPSCVKLNLTLPILFFCIKQG
ncbi:MAG: hypothetical protein IPP77_10920 [Bacteroidetes bacterium]|nr:hypothetical protein [Bacteroidota bacterium]